MVKNSVEKAPKSKKQIRSKKTDKLKSLKKQTKKTTGNKSAFATYLFDTKHKINTKEEEDATNRAPRNENEATISTEKFIEIPDTFAAYEESDVECYQAESGNVSGFETTLNTYVDENLTVPEGEESVIETDSHPAEIDCTDTSINVEECDGNWKILSLNPERSHVLLAFKDLNEDVKIFGCGLIKALKGSAKILGYTLTPANKGEKFYAPVTHSALTLRPIPDDGSLNYCEEDFKLDFLYPEVELPENFLTQVTELYENHTVILLFSSLNEETNSLVYPGYPDLYKPRPTDGLIKNRLNMGSFIVHSEKYFHEYPAYGNACDKILKYARNSKNNCQRPVIATTGGKGTGKSTFNHYLINQILQESPCVYYLDCDIGQPEFTPPGMISLTCVSEQLLGPPFTHLIPPLSSVYYGNITAAGLPDFYIQCIRHVLDAAPSNHFPLIVNTMGWNRALGLHLLLDTLRMVNPTHIIQLVSKKESKNLPFLTKQYVSEAVGWSENKLTVQPSTHELITMDIDINMNDIVVYRPSDLRELRLLSYLQSMQDACIKLKEKIIDRSLSLSSLCSISPYRVKLSDLTLCVAHETGLRRSHALALFNASIVGLCIASENTPHKEISKYLPPAPLADCMGLGIVRGIDPNTDTLFIISDLEQKVLEKINCLVLGVISLPEALCPMNKKGVEILPYTSGSLFQVKGSSKFRVYRNFVK